MRELLSAAIKQGKKITLFFVDGTELDEISATGNYKIFGSGDILSVTRCDDPTQNFVINLSLVKYFTAS
ncbi:hypothetical protein [uncultured Vagococcus sp.]|uniref:hypothetical protein n=1 Tax=uncultured Vagococcus sp. TaxID=189676 RepID=UPI0028D40BA7|nr:hypothetical protein [uncultured Vagococcus sp.]